MYDSNDNYKFLPKIYRDFSDQGYLFKDLYNNINYKETIKKEIAIPLNKFHVNCMDIFLFQLALHGYTLQSNNANTKTIYPKFLRTENDQVEFTNRVFFNTDYENRDIEIPQFKFYKITKEEFKYNCINIFLEYMHSIGYILKKDKRFFRVENIDFLRKYE